MHEWRGDEWRLDTLNFYEGSEASFLVFHQFHHPLPGTCTIVCERHRCCGWELEFLAVLWHLSNFDLISPGLCSLASSFEETTSKYIPLTCVKHWVNLLTQAKCRERGWGLSSWVEHSSEVSKVLVLAMAYANILIFCCVSTAVLIVVYNYLCIQDGVVLLLGCKAQSPSSGSHSGLGSATLQCI